MNISLFPNKQWSKCFSPHTYLSCKPTVKWCCYLRTALWLCIYISSRLIFKRRVFQHAVKQYRFIIIPLHVDYHVYNFYFWIDELILILKTLLSWQKEFTNDIFQSWCTHGKLILFYFLIIIIIIGQLCTYIL